MIFVAATVLVFVVTLVVVPVAIAALGLVFLVNYRYADRDCVRSGATSASDPLTVVGPSCELGASTG
jgi:hypothetical protein